MFDVLFVVPTYKKRMVSESRTVVTLSNSMHLSGVNFNFCVFIWNNGPEEIVNDVGESNLEILQFVDNASLAYVYNNTISKIQAKYYVIFDDDTDVTPCFIRDLFVNVYSKSVNILAVPQISCMEKVISPIVDKSSLVLKPGYIFSKGFRAIGSGLIIPKNVVDALKPKVFDENLSLYGVDTVFCYDYQKSYDSLLVLSSNLNHDVAGMSNESLSKFLIRELNLIEALIYMIKRNKGQRLLNIRRVVSVALKSA